MYDVIVCAGILIGLPVFFILMVRSAFKESCRNGECAFCPLAAECIKSFGEEKKDAGKR